MAEDRQLELWDAAEAGDPAGVLAALARGADPDQPLPGSEYRAWLADPKRRKARVVNDSGLTDKKFYVLFEALEKSAVLEALLTARPRLDVVNDNYYEDRPTAVHQLVHPWYREEEDDHAPALLKSLLAAGAPLERLYQGHTPLQLICRRKGRLDLLEILLAHGASVKVIDQEGYSILHLATVDWSFEELWLRESIARGTYHTADGQPVGLGRAGWMRLDQSDYYKPIGPYTPKAEDDLYDPASLWGVREVVKALVAAGADPNAVNPHTGDTPLHMRSDGRIHLESMEALLEFGARADIRNHDGCLPSDFFFREDDPEALALQRRMIAMAPECTSF